MKSMTGFGTASGRAAGTRLTVELRSVNQRHLDVKLALPRDYACWESDLRRVVSESVARGRVELSVARSVDRGVERLRIRKDAVAAYVTALRALQREFHLGGEIDVSLVAARHDVFDMVERKMDPEVERVLLMRLVRRALAAHTHTRAREGSHLRRDMDTRRRALVRLRREMASLARGAGEQMRRRLQNRIEDAIGRNTADPARLLQEVAIVVDRSDVTEELVRLQSHLDSLAILLREPEPVGKRIDFLLQEIHREFNTVGSKAAQIEWTQLVLAAKAEVEKLREQVQNVE